MSLGKVSSVNTLPIIEDAMKKFNISFDEIFNVLIYYLYYNSTDFKGAIHDNKQYYELPNMWARRTDFNKNEAEKGCNRYMHCDLESREVDGPIELLYHYYHNDEYKGYFGDDPDLDDKYKNVILSDEFEDFMKSLGQKMNYTLCNGVIKLDNPCGVNEDHRGSDHCEITLPFYGNMELHNPTLDEFIKALYWLKSHKFDKWYELYSSCDIKKSVYLHSDRDEDVVFEITFYFDHGS